MEEINENNKKIELEFALLKILLKECEIKIDNDKIEPNTYRWMINKLILMRADLPLSEELLSLQDKLLLKENESSLIDLNKIKFFGRIKSVNFSLLDSNVDCLIILVDSFFDYNFNENEINSQIILKAGLEFKRDLFSIQKEMTYSYNDEFNIIKGRNLNSKYVVEILKSEIERQDNFDKKFSNVLKFINENNLKTIGLIIGNTLDKGTLNSIIKQLKHNKKLKIFINS